MSNRNDQYQHGRSRERSPLRPDRFSTSYGGCSPGPCPPGPQPPQYEPYPAYHSSGYQATHAHQYQQDSSPLRPATITTRPLGIPLVFKLIILAQAVAFIFFYDLPTKLDDYSKATARMREQQDAMRREARHLESERIALRGESSRLEKQRLAFESATLEMEGERDALESAIRRSEQERSRLEREKEELREEREKWEKAREDRVPQGAFWDVVWPAWDCRAYGTREYWGILQNIPEDWTDLDACMNMPVEIEGVTLRRPYRCAHVEDSPYIHGYWMVEWGQPDCQPWHRNFHDKGCTNPGSGMRRIEAQIVGIPNRKEQDWRLLCGTTPMTWNHITYNAPTHCDSRRYGRKVAMWDIPDESC